MGGVLDIFHFPLQIYFPPFPTMLCAWEADLCGQNQWVWKMGYGISVGDGRRKKSWGFEFPRLPP